MNKILIDLNTQRMSGRGKGLNGGNTLFGLNDLCKKYIKPEHSVLELGVNNAVSTQLFAYYANKVIGIDVKDPLNKEEIIQKYPNIIFVKNSFEAFFENNKELFDLIYIDGFHDYKNVYKDINLSLPFVKNNGIICGHDYNKVFPGVKKAVKDIFNIEPELFSDSSWLIHL